MLLCQLPYPEGKQHHASCSISHALSNKKSCYHLQREVGLVVPPGAVVVNFEPQEVAPSIFNKAASCITLKLKR